MSTLDKEKQVYDSRGIYVRVACSTNQLKNLGRLPLANTLWKKINGDPFDKMKDLSKSKLQLGCWSICFDIGSKEVGVTTWPHMVPFSIEDVVEKIGILNQGALLAMRTRWQPRSGQ